MPIYGPKMPILALIMRKKLFRQKSGPYHEKVALIMRKRAKVALIVGALIMRGECKAFGEKIGNREAFRFKKC